MDENNLYIKKWEEGIPLSELEFEMSKNLSPSLLKYYWTNNSQAYIWPLRDNSKCDRKENLNLSQLLN